MSLISKKIDEYLIQSQFLYIWLLSRCRLSNHIGDFLRLKISIWLEFYLVKLYTSSHFSSSRSSII